jgi:hypothetical protein
MSQLFFLQQFTIRPKPIQALISGIKGQEKRKQLLPNLIFFLQGSVNRAMPIQRWSCPVIHDKNLPQVLFSVVISHCNTNGGEG